MSNYPAPKKEVLRKYNLTEEQWWQLFGDGICPICERPYRYDYVHRRAVVDHSHYTYEVRGLLCSACNYDLGAFHDDYSWFDNAAKYLKQPPASQMFDPVPLHYLAPVRHNDRVNQEDD